MEKQIAQMTSDRIKEIHLATAYPESVSVQQALLQVWNECEQWHNAAVQGYREALEKIAELCDNQNPTHADIWYIAHEHLCTTPQALSKAEDKGDNGWISVEDKNPICYQTGDWDGKRSELVLCENSKGYHIAVLYEGVMDGCKFSDWFDKDDWSIETPFRWKTI